MQTDLAKRCNPPKNFLLSSGRFFSIFVAVFALPVGCMHATMSGSSFPINIGLGGVWMLISAVVASFTFAALFRFLGVTRRHKMAIERWRSSFLCLDCGNEFSSRD